MKVIGFRVYSGRRFEPPSRNGRVDSVHGRCSVFGVRFAFIPDGGTRHPAGYESVVSVDGTSAARRYLGFGNDKGQPRLGRQFEYSCVRSGPSSECPISEDDIELPDRA